MRFFSVVAGQAGCSLPVNKEEEERRTKKRGEGTGGGRRRHWHSGQETLPQVEDGPVQESRSPGVQVPGPSRQGGSRNQKKAKRASCVKEKEKDEDEDEEEDAEKEGREGKGSRGERSPPTID